MSTLNLELPPKLIPVFTADVRYRGAYGGRGSAKTRTFAKMAAVRGLMFAKAGREGIILCGREFMNSLDESSMAEVKAAIASEPWLAANYDVGEKYIRTNCGRVQFKFAGLRHNLDSIKSKALILILWVDEAEPVTETAWQKVVPTVREHGSEIWVTWNPERKKSATHKRFREDPPESSAIVEMNWQDNPWFPDVLDQERREDEIKRPDQYAHIWEGDFKTIYEGAYYAKHLSEARKQGRICKLTPDPMMTVRTYHDLAGASDKADAYSIWVSQFINKDIRVYDHYGTQGQSPEMHVRWLREWCIDRGFKRCIVNLPHDGSQVHIDNSWENIWNKASTDEVKFVVNVIEGQGKGAAMIRVTASQRIFHQVWFDEEATAEGRESLAAYHEKRNEDRDIGLGPEHDWSSHDADSFGLMCCDYSESMGESNAPRDKYARSARKRKSAWAAV